jgi:hypothetical protein
LRRKGSELYLGGCKPLGAEALLSVALDIDSSILISVLPLDVMTQILRVEVMLMWRVGL